MSSPQCGVDCPSRCRDGPWETRESSGREFGEERNQTAGSFLPSRDYLDHQAAGKPFQLKIRTAVIIQIKSEPTGEMIVFTSTSDD